MIRFSLLSLFLSFCLAACAPLEPAELPEEVALPKAHGLLWDSLATAHGDDWLVLLNDNADALDWRLQAIDAAESAIDLQTFLWKVDTAGAAILEHLIQAADRGVKVRILVDDALLVGDDALVGYMFTHPNIEYRIYNPYGRRASSFAVRTALNLAEFHRLDHRMHNKSMIVDGEIAIVGGRNLADEYFGLHQLTNFRDLELLVGGLFVETLEHAFDAYWNDRWSVPVERLTHLSPVVPDHRLLAAKAAEVGNVHAELADDERVHAWRSMLGRALDSDIRLLLDAPPTGNPANAEEAPVQVANELEQLFDRAEREIVIVSAYLIPTPDLEGAVERAIARGVSVRMLTNSISSTNHLSAHAAYRNHVGTLLRHGVALYEVRADARDRHLYMNRPTDAKQLALHAKALIIDSDKVFIGSANLDPRSLRINTEMGLLVTGTTLNASLRDVLKPDFAAGNAWNLQLGSDGRTRWVSGNTVLQAQPAATFMQRIEDWLFATLPIEDEL